MQVVTPGDGVGLAVEFLVHCFTQPEVAAEGMDGTVFRQQGRIGLRSVAIILQGVDHDDLVVFYFAADGFTGRTDRVAVGVRPVGRVPEADKRLADRGWFVLAVLVPLNLLGHQEAQIIPASGERLAVEDVLAIIVEIAVVVQVEPSIQMAARHGGVYLQRGVLADQQCRREENAIIHRVAAGISNQLLGVFIHGEVGIRFTGHSLAQIVVADQQMPWAVVVQRCRIGRIGGVAEVDIGDRHGEERHAVKTVVTQRVACDIADTCRPVVQDDRVAARFFPQSRTRDQGDHVGAVVVDEEVIDAFLQRLAAVVLEHLYGRRRDRMIIDADAAGRIDQLDREDGQLFVHHEHVVGGHVAVDAARVVIHRVDDDCHRRTEVDTIDRAAVLEYVVTDTRRRLGIRIIATKLTEEIHVGCQDG